jgi:hypothetical protein
MHCLKYVHIQGTYKKFPYIKGTLGRGILFKRNGNTTLQVYTDADYMESVVDKRSLQGTAPYLEEIL